MTSLDMPTVRDSAARRVDVLPVDDATTYAEWFACLAEPTRVRLLHLVATRPAGITVGELTESLGISQPTVSHHVRKLADVGFVRVHKHGTSTVVTVNPACCTGLPHAADAVMGVLTPRPCCPTDLPADVSVRALTDADWAAARRIYGEGIATRNATFATEVPDREHLDSTWLPDHRWVAEIDGEVVGWAALAPVSGRECYAGVAENSVYVAETARGRGVGKSLLHRQVIAADAAGLWTLQTSIFPENRASIGLHHSAGFRTVGVRERIAVLDGVWRDTVLLERRAASDGGSSGACAPSAC
ncbi:helix-turn-helix domain-containing GNAT family N-acetyltransferase [Nocardia asteroides]|uniref:helix-turn-helix domain-containing GNAT family N-acetyltransferase n=1 Tax=Nocardia asteroides TaxID=1824 RepID=UPI00365B165E